MLSPPPQASGAPRRPSIAGTGPAIRSDCVRKPCSDGTGRTYSGGVGPQHAEVDDVAVVGGRILTGLLDVTSDLSALDSTGTWAVVLPFSGAPVCARFERSATPAGDWRTALGVGRKAVPPVAGWESSLDRQAYAKGVVAIREAIATSTR
jgi:hypothetical protein